MTINKKADERMLSIYLFIINIIVSIGIVSGVILFYGSHLDIRVTEAGVLNSKVADCLTDQGRLENSSILVKGFDLISLCHLNFVDNTESSNGEKQYAVSIKLFELSSCSNLRCSNPKKEFYFGQKDLLEYCNLNGKYLPKCNTQAAYIFSGGEPMIMQITSVVSKTKNVK
jgi:hypothetical protein